MGTNYRLLPEQKSACEALWRAMTERRETPLGLCLDMLPQDKLEARYIVAETVRMIPRPWLPGLLAADFERHGPLRPAHKFEWDERDTRAPRGRAP